MVSNDEYRRERSLLIQKKNIKFGKKKQLKLNRLNMETANLTDYNTSIPREWIDGINYERHNLNNDNYETDASTVTNLLWAQNVSVNIADK